MTVSLLYWFGCTKHTTFTIKCDENMVVPHFTHSLCVSSPCSLVTTTVDLVEEPLWLFELLKQVCTSLDIVVICNSKVIQPAGSNPPIIFDLDVAEFVRSFCLPCESKSVEHLSLLQTIRPAPQDPNQHELSALKSSLRSGWQSGHVVICSTDGAVLLDGATRVFLLNHISSSGVSGTLQLPVVCCLQQTPAWIINAIIVLLSQSDDRRTWSPSDTLNLASFQIESLRQCQQEVKQTAIRRLRKEKVFKGVEEFIDIASVVQSRDLCSEIARNLVLKNGSVYFFKNLSTKIFLEHCKRVSAGSVFMRKPCQELMSHFVSNLQSQTVPAVLHDMFKCCEHDSIRYGIRVEHTHSVGTVLRLVLKWNSDKMRHESKSHYVSASQQYNRFEFKDRNQNSLIASKCVASLVPELGCMQGTANTAWLCVFPKHSVNVTALDSFVEEESITVCDKETTVDLRTNDSMVLANSQKGIVSERERVTPLRPQRNWKPCLSDELKHELWLSLVSVEYNFQTLWHYIAEHQSDLLSFESKMEARLQSLFLYHADLYRDNRFSEIGAMLITKSMNIQKGSNVTPPQKALLLQFFKQYRWFLTPVLWNRAELLFLLVCVFDPRLLFVQVIQNDAKSQIDKRQNRGIALSSNFLTGILLQRLVDFDLLNWSPSCEAIVVDSNGSCMQYFQAQRTIDCFKAMSPLKVISVSNAPAALSCNGLYTQISEHLFAQNVAYPQNGDQPEPRIIQVTEGRWCFKLLLAHGVDCWLMRQAESDVSQHPEDVQSWQVALTGREGDYSACSVGITEEKPENAFEFDFGSGGGYVRAEHDSQDFISTPHKKRQKYADRNAHQDSPEIDAHCEIVSETSVVDSPMSVFDGPLCALFCLMFGTSLGLSDCSMQIPIGACIMSNFFVPHRDPFCFINRRALQLFNFNQEFSKKNLERRFRVLACSKQRQAHGRVDFYDLSLLHNLSTFDISPGIRLCPLERSHIVFRNEWVYTGDVNLDNEPNGFGSMCFTSDNESVQCGFFQNGFFIRACDSSDSAVVATRHVNTLFLLLQVLACGSNASSVVADDTDVEKTFLASLKALEQYLHHVSFTVLENLFDATTRLPTGLRISSCPSNSLKSTVQTFFRRLVVSKRSSSRADDSVPVNFDDASFDEASFAVQHIHTENAVGHSTVALGDETVGHLRSDTVDIDDGHLSLDYVNHDLPPSINVHALLEPNLSSSLQAAPSAALPSHILKQFILKKYAFKYFSCDDISRHSELEINSQELNSALQSLCDERFLCPHSTEKDLLCISIDKRQWSDFTLIFPDKSCVNVLHKDCGIWLNSTIGLPSDAEPMPFKCFSIHVALSYSAISGTIVSPWQLETYMQYRFQQFRTALEFIQGSDFATQLMTEKVTAANLHHNYTQIDLDHVANSAFWLDMNRLQELANSGGPENYVSMWAFLFLPLEFLQYNYLVINTRAQSDNPASADVVGGCFHFISDNHKADTITLRFEGSESGHFSSLSFLNPQQCFAVTTKIISEVNTTQIKFKKVRTEIWDTIADIFVDVSLENFSSNLRPQFQWRIPETDVIIISDDLQRLGGSQCSPGFDFVGLQNPNAVLCAFNSLLQAWFYIVPFRNAVLSSTSQDNSLNRLKTVFHCLQKRRRDICVNDFVSNSSCFSLLDDGREQCVHEIFVLLSNHLMETKNASNVGNTAASAYIKEHFLGEFQRKTVVPEKYSNNQTESFVSLSYCLSSTIESSIRSEHSEIDVQVNLGSKSSPDEFPGKTQLCITKFPSVLHVHLKRFDRFNGLNCKLCSSCSFGDILDLHDVFGDSLDPPQYLLHSVLVHTGSSPATGHYYVFIRPDITKNDWFRFDDSKVTRASQKQAIDANFGNNRGGPTAYMLIYLKNSSQVLPQVQSLQSPYDEKEELLKEAVVIMTRISALNKNSFLGQQKRRGKAADDFQMGSTCLDKLTVVVDEMYQRYSESSACAALSKRVAEACYHLQSAADELDSSASKKAFLRRCESFARRFDKPKFWTDQAADSNCNWNQKYCDELLILRTHQGIPDYVCKPHPESYQEAVETPVNISTCRVPFLNPFTMLMNDACIDWFFMALTVLFPAYAYLPCTVCGFRQKLSQAQERSFEIWLGNFKSRRSTAVLLPVNLPSNLQNCISSTNRGAHWVLITMGCKWVNNKAGWCLSQVEVECMDPADTKSYKAAALQWFQEDLLPLFNSSHASYPKASSAKLQFGADHFHCGAFIMSLGLNFVMGTLKSIYQHLLLVGKTDSSLVGLDLRKMAVWDSVQDPPLLDACLYMCPSFKHVRNFGFACHSWWKCTPHYDLRKCLNVELGSSGTFLMSGFSQGVRRGRTFQQEKEGCNSGFCFGYPSICVENHVATDGPFFYSNDEYFVKVYCIGLFGHFQKDRASVSRARRAFHDASATSYFCEKNQWPYKSFGLICFGLATPSCFVCIARKTLNVAILSEQTIGSLCVTVTEKTKSMHGDVHSSNVLLNLENDEFEFVDCERAFRLSSEGPSAWFYSWYAYSVAHQKQLEIGIIMDKLSKSGLKGTSVFFVDIYQAGEFLNIAFDSKLFEQCPEYPWTYDSFLHLMELLSSYDPVISGTIVNVYVTVKLGRFDYTINVERLEYCSVIKVATSSPQQDSCIESKRTLANESDTTIFFNALVTASKGSEDVAKSSAQAPTCAGLTKLMSMLDREAISNQDSAPELQNSHGKSFISCHIRPVCSRNAAVHCKIYFERIGTGSIKIVSAEFAHENVSLLSLLKSNFERLKPTFNLESGEVVERFFDFALSMKELYDSTDSSSDSVSDTVPSPLVKEKKRADNMQGSEQIPRVPAVSDTTGSGGGGGLRSLPKHDYLLRKIEKHGNRNVLRSIRESMRRRFGDEGSLKDFNISAKPILIAPNPKLREEHFGCETVLVHDGVTRTRCITFVQSQTHLSLDTETTVPRHKDEQMSLIQIGTSTTVFIIQVALHSTDFFSSLGAALSGKTLLCWGDEEAKLQKIVKTSGSTFKDVQKEYSSSSQLKGLGKAIQELLEHKYVLDKNWRLSGWDNVPLTKGQLKYAALDVVCCHALYVAFLHGSHSVYETEGKHITFYACDCQSGSKVKQGFSFAPDFLGHYNNDTVSRGFQFSQSRPLMLQGFRVLEDANYTSACVNVNEFVDLLNNFKFCCALCSSCWFRTEFKINLTKGKNLCSITKGGKIAHVPRCEVSDNAFEQKAYDCLTILASGLELSLELSPSKENLHHLNQSVRSDIFYGYIRETLGHLEVFSSSNSFFGHYVGTTASRGFRLESGSPYPQGFKAASVACDYNPNLVSEFTSLLNSNKFCCSQCMDSFTRFFQFSPHAIPAALTDGKRCFGINKGSVTSKGSAKYSRHEVVYDAHKSFELNEAIFCLSMLRAYFGLNKDTTNLDDNILYSVLQDIHDGYISKTLAYLVV